MISFPQTQIANFSFEQEIFSDIRGNCFGEKWPVVYIIEDKGGGFAYIGETTNIFNRVTQHWSNPKRKKLKSIHILHNKVFNKSVILDLEAFLIRYIAGDGIYKLQNGNGGQYAHNYYQQKVYQKEFRSIWKVLKENKLVVHEIRDIENSDLFKYSPYKTLNEDQYNIISQIIKDLKYDIKHNVQSRISLIEGGAGTGKSILGIFLLKLLVDAQNQLKIDIEEESLDNNLNYIAGSFNSNLKLGYVVPMQNFRKTLKRVFKGVNGLSPKMVLSPAEVANATEPYDILIIDESHRLRRRNGLSGPGDYIAFDAKNAKFDLGAEGTELDWILRNSKYQFFFYDPTQSIKPTDVLPVRFFELYQKKETCKYKLISQLRCKGGNDYIEYVQNILSCRQNGKIQFGEYEFKIFDNVDDMVCEIKKKDKEIGLCRNIAGYAWEWKTKGKSLSVIQKEGLFDIEIEGYKYNWNQKDTDWINSPNSINEIGCIHTTQGFDLNYAGVILGPEIDYDPINNEIVIFKDKYKDTKGKIGITDTETLLGYLKNIYTTILERGIYGTYVYACNDSLREYLKKFLDFVPHVKTDIRYKVPAEKQFTEYLPVYTIKAACGYFGEGEPVDILNWIKVENMGKLSHEMFVVQAVGHSMEPLIHDGDFCIFRANPVGSRRGKVVLTQHRNFYDADNSGGYSIKDYSSTKRYNEFGEWTHDEIILKPKNKNYDPIIIREDEAEDFRVIGEFIGVIEC